MIKTVVLYPKMYIWYRKNKKIVLSTLKMKFLSKYFTKMYKFWIKTVVLYPKMYIWSWKIKKIVLFTLKMKFLQNNFTKMYKFWIKTVVLYPKMYIWSWKIQKNCTFYTKNEVFAKKFHQNVQILDKKKLYFCTPKMYTFVWFRKMEIIVLFTLKMKFCQKISPKCKNCG